MKKSKILLVAVLSVILCLVCIMTSTFSWFTRPQKLTGDKLLLPGDSYEISNGNDVSFVTYESTNNGRTYGTTAVTNFSGTINAGERRMFRTDVMNSGSQDQSVSLFLTNLIIPSGSNGMFYLGVNSPLKTYKGYNRSTESSATVKNINKKDVYVAFKEDASYDASKFYIHYWGDGVSTGDAQLAYSYSHGTITNSSSQTYKVYHAVVPYNAKCGLVMANYSGNQYWFKSNELNGDHLQEDNTDMDSENYFFVNVKAPIETSLVYKGTHDTDVAAGLKSFYSEATVKAGSTIDLSATGQAIITYKSSDYSVATVNSSGVVTGVSAGETTITVTSTGARGDTQTSTCTVTVLPSDDVSVSFVPVVTNVRVVAGGNTEDGSAIESIYWYIKNDSDTTLTYTVGSLDLTL